MQHGERTRNRIKQRRKTTDVCEACGKKGDDHEGGAEYIDWIGCGQCMRWYVQECRELPHLCEQDKEKWICHQCINTQRLTEVMVREWSDANTGWEAMRSRIQAMEKTIKKVNDEVMTDTNAMEARR